MKFNKKFLFPVIFSALNAVFYAQNSGSDIFSDQKFIEQKETKAKALGLFSKKNLNYECGNFSYYAPNQFFKLESSEGTVYYNSSLKMAGFRANYYHQIYYIFINEDTRKKMKSNVERYIEEFNARQLSKKGKTYKKYGEEPARLEWGTFSSMIDAHGNGKIQFGYRFFNDSPYFTVTVWPVKNLEKHKAAGSDKSVKIQFFYTKKQAETLANLLENENLSEKLKPYFENETNSKNKQNNEIESDKY